MPDTKRHRDITSKYLEAALLDQSIAGAFQGKPYAHIAVCTNRGWVLGVAVANERGYNSTNKKFETEKDAKEWADGLNEHIGLTKDEERELEERNRDQG